jgi:hypothetical protein
MTFIVRLIVAADGAVRGVVERPTTGEKHRFQSAEALGAVVALMARKAALLALIGATAADPSAAQIATRTFTSTALPTATRTATRTFTPTSVPPTATRTPTFTNTALPPGSHTATANFTATGLPIRSSTPTPPIPAGLSISDVAILEGDTGTRAAIFAVRLRGNVAYPVKVTAKTVDGTATAGSDYDGLVTTLLFSPAENQKTISVAVRGDRFVEATETFTVILGAAVGAPLGDAAGIGTILSDEELNVGVPELVPANPVTAPDDLTSLVLRWAHPDRWRELNTVDLRLRDGDRPVLWTRFDEAANSLAFCDADGRCGAGVAPGTGAPIAGAAATFYPAESAVRGSGPSGPSVDLIFTFSLARSLAGRILQVETAASEDAGAQQAFLPIASLEVIDPESGDAGGDGCTIQSARGGGRLGGGAVALGALALIGLAIGRRSGPGR